MTGFEELFQCGAKVRDVTKAYALAEVEEPLLALEKGIERTRKSFSGSWLGYHSRVYYEGFQVPPPGAHFSQEWGLKNMSVSTLGSRGRWQEFDYDTVKATIREWAGNPDLEPARVVERAAAQLFEATKSEVISILEAEDVVPKAGYLEQLLTEAKALELASASAVADKLCRHGQIMSRDAVAMGQGFLVPPHVALAAEVISIRLTPKACEELASLCNKAASHLERISRKERQVSRIGTDIFIGHGRSGEWRKLKDFVQDRLSLPWDEFNRVPVAGITNIARLAEMLDAASVAFVILTGEDEMVDGQVQARMNVIHEVGLFQGRLGFTRAIVLLEDGCEEFSNIQGLGQIRFPKGRIEAVFEEVRLLLEREGMLGN